VETAIARSELYRDIEGPLRLLAASPIRSGANKRAIYTAIMGASDALRNPVFVEPNVDYVCFTNDEHLRSGIWKIVHVDIGARDPVWVAKIAKILPHKVLHGYEESIWIDGSVLLCRSLWDLVRTHLKPATAAIGVFTHPNRSCIYEEAVSCIAQCKDDPSVIHKQVDVYRRDGYPESRGRVTGGFMYRRHQVEIFDLMMRWLEQVQMYSIRDQLSLNYVAWKQNDELGLIDLDIFHNEFFVVMPHKTATGYAVRSIWRRASHWFGWRGLRSQRRVAR